MSSPRVRATDPVTSREAAGSVAPLDWRVLAAAVRLGFFHDAMLAELVGNDRNVVARRRLDLEELGFVERHADRWGKPSTAVGPKGRPVLVFTVTEKGKQALMDEVRRRREASAEGR
jgi:hypothetical protein